MTLRWSIRVNNDAPGTSYPALACCVEAAGFDQLWVSHDLFWRSALVLIPSMLAQTQRVAIGIGIANPYTIHPAELAMVAATLDELSNGRFRLGLGAGAAEFLQWVGIAQEKPLAAVRRAVTQIRRVLAGEPVPGWDAAACLRFPARPVPIYLGGFGPRMLQLAGELADGALPLLLPPERYADVAATVAEGAARAGRSLDDLDLAACVWCSVAEDRKAAEAALREKFAYYGPAFDAATLARVGLTPEDLLPAQHALVAGDRERALRLVPSAVLDLALVGRPPELIPRLEQLVALGARHLSFGPPLGPDPVAAVTLLGRTVLPHFAQH